MRQAEKIINTTKCPVVAVCCTRRIFYFAKIIYKKSINIDFFVLREKNICVIINVNKYIYKYYTKTLSILLERSAFMKRLILLLLAVTFTLSLCSCKGLGVNIAESLSPPKPMGELYDIQQALEAYVGENVRLVYPSAGRYRSAIVTRDLDGDERFEVFSFYSTETDDKTTVMHINYIKWTDSGWESVSDIEVNCSGVESVEFATMDYSGVPKIIVNWTRYSAVNKLVSVYDINKGDLREVTGAEYSVSAVTDFNNDGVSEIVAVYLDAENNTSTAQLLSLNEEGFEQKGVCTLDGTVESYFEPIFSKLTDGTPALFIDAAKPMGMITEIVYLRNGEFVNAFASDEHGENHKTLRASSVRSADFNGDGSVDIPLAEKLPSEIGATQSDTVYMTVWSSFDGHVFETISHTVINYTDGYYIEVPEKWLGSFTVTRKLDTRQRFIVRWNDDTATLGEEVLRIQTVKLKDWDGNQDNYEGYFELTRSSEFAYIMKMGNSALNPGEEVMKNSFHLIK